MARVLLGVVALALALAGCGGDPKADPAPTPSTPVTSASTPPAPTASMPSMPAEAKANTKAGAIAFVRYYVTEVNHAQGTGDVRPLQVLESPACRSCRAASSGVRTHYATGGSIAGGDWKITSASALPNAAISGWVVDLSVSYGPQTVSFGSGKPDRINKPGRMIATFQIQRLDDHWQVLEWTRGS